MKRRSSRGYTLVETLVAIGIVALAVAAASQLSLSMAMQDEMNQYRARALNYAEVNARLWQLGVTPTTVLLTEPDTADSTNTAMSVNWSSVTNVGFGEDYGSNAGTVEKVTVTVGYKPPGKSSDTTMPFTVFRPVSTHR